MSGSVLVHVSPGAVINGVVYALSHTFIKSENTLVHFSWFSKISCILEVCTVKKRKKGKKISTITSKLSVNKLSW